MKKTFVLIVFAVLTISVNAQFTKLFESFETSVPPPGWRAINVTGPNVWNRIVAPLPAALGTLNAKHGSAVAFINYQAPTGEDWLVTSRIPVIASGDSVVFWLVKQFSDGPYPYDSLLVRVSTTDSLQASFTQYAGSVCVHCIPVGAPEIIWRRYSFPLTAWAGNSIFLSFVHKDSDGHGMVLDSISVFGTDATGINPVANTNPEKFELYQNFPNPFNPVTKIDFDIPKAGFTTLKVYDVTGSEVATLVSGDIKNGKYSIDFDATNLSSGIYYYRLESGGLIKTNKMSLVK
ncbi:MAG: T9SS type A sorting domain-containing protein [Ignavibacteria bacterium]|nr:T9SS type A sorting domain-containing protein [Ignavibacteria bacterium]